MVFFEKFLVKNDQKYVLRHDELKIKQHRRRGDNLRNICALLGVRFTTFSLGMSKTVVVL